MVWEEGGGGAHLGGLEALELFLACLDFDVKLGGCQLLVHAAKLGVIGDDDVSRGDGLERAGGHAGQGCGSGVVAFSTG